MPFELSKNLAGIGALLLFFSVLASPVGASSVSGVIALIGVILLLIGVKGLADYYHEAAIFHNVLYGILTGIGGIVVAIVIAVSIVLTSLTSFLHKLYPGWNGNWMSLSGMTPVTTNLTLSDVAPFITAFLLVFVILFIVTIIGAIFYRRALSALKSRSGIGLFGTTGMILLIGAILTIILIGYILVWIAFLLMAIAFFELKPLPVQPSPSTQPTVLPPRNPSEPQSTPMPSAPAPGMKYCPNCGAQIPSTATYCPVCGRKQS